MLLITWTLSLKIPEVNYIILENNVVYLENHILIKNVDSDKTFH